MWRSPGASRLSSRRRHNSCSSAVRESRSVSTLPDDPTAGDERADHHPRHGSRRVDEPLRERATDHAASRGLEPQRHGVRLGLRSSAVDASLPRLDVHGRSGRGPIGRLGASARSQSSHTGGTVSRSRLPDCRLRRKHALHVMGLRSAARFRALRRLFVDLGTARPVILVHTDGALRGSAGSGQPLRHGAADAPPRTSRSITSTDSNRNAVIR